MQKKYIHNLAQENYHCLLTASTLAFGFDYPWDDIVAPQSLSGFLGGWRWDDGFVDALAWDRKMNVIVVLW